MADDDRRGALLARELADQRVGSRRVRGIELAGWLVRDQQPRPVSESARECDPLLLAARELGRKCVASVCETDAFEELIRSGMPFRAGRSQQRGLKRDEIAGAQLRCERERIVLVDVAEHSRAIVAEPSPAQLAQVVAEHAHVSGRRRVEPGEDPKQRRLSRAARAEDDDDFAYLDVHGQAL